LPFSSLDRAAGRPVGRTVDTLTGRCHVPDDLEAVTDVGATDPGDDRAERLWELVEAVYRTGMHPGIQVCVRRGGETMVERSIGHARGNLPWRRFDPDAAVPLTVDTPINLFSAAKAVTAMQMHKLDESGVLSLDDPVADHVPGFERHGKHEITIRQVLSHRAGIPTLPGHGFDLELLADHERVEELVRDLRPSTPPEEFAAYHAVTGGLVMEAVARRATGSSLRALLASSVKEPLGLRWFDYGVAAEQTGEVAMNVETGFPLIPPLEQVLHRALGRPWREVLHLSNDDRFLSGVIPSGNVIVTARDVAAYYQCLLDGGELDGIRLFESDTVDRARQPIAEGHVIDRMLGMPMRYSTGFMLGSEQVSLYGWNHPEAFGHVGMSNVFTWADPERDLVVALLMTGKPVLGTHLVALPRLIAGIHEEFPPV
jgi:CubicO group peptidase (beta-lactamase class C family)